MLSRHRVGIPKTLFVKGTAEVLPGIDRLGGPPVVVKLLEGTQGIGVILADSTKMAEAVIETLSGPGRMNVLLQQFISESRGRDIRALVVGSDLIVSVCPPGAALDLARQIATLGYTGIYVDANAVSPRTAREIAGLFDGTEADFVDGGIVGPPAARAGTTRLHLSGERASEVARCFAVECPFEPQHPPLPERTEVPGIQFPALVQQAQRLVRVPLAECSGEL